MNKYAVIAVTLLVFAAAAPARVVSLGDEPPAAIPEYNVAASATADTVLADAREYFEEQSYAWALEAANALAERWPDSPARAESDYYRLRCLMQLSRFAELDEAFDEYFDRHGDSPWAAEAVDFLLDVYTDCEYVLEDYTRRKIAYAWDEYVERTHGYNFTYGAEGSLQLDRKRWEILALGDEIYEKLMARGTQGEARLRWADRRVFNYVKASTFLDWGDYLGDEEEYYRKRTEFNERVAEFEMSEDMRSAVAFLDALLDLYAKPAPPGGPGRDRTYRPDYDAWLDAQRLGAARARWEEVAGEYGAAPGALMARAALAHYKIVYDNDAEAGVAALEEFAASAGAPESTAFVEAARESLSTPVLAITKVSTDAGASPAVEAAVACRGFPEVEAGLYEIDAARYPAFFGSFTNAGVSAEELPGVVSALGNRRVATGTEPGNYRIAEVTVPWEDVGPGFYLLEVRAGEELSRAVFSVSGAALISIGDGYDYYFRTVDAVSGEPIPITLLRTWQVRYDNNNFRKIEAVEAVSLPAREEAGGVVLDLRSIPGMSSVYVAAETALGPVIHAVGTEYGTYGSEPRKLTGKVITDRPLYKPGDTVHYKVIWREVDYLNKDLKAAAGKDFSLGLYSDYYELGEPVWATSGRTNDYGTSPGEFVLPEKTRLGGLSLRAKITEGDKDYYARGNVNVAEFEKPEYELHVKADKEHYVAGERVQVGVEGAYYFGEPMAGAPVAFDVTYYVHRRGDGETRTLFEGERARLDADGRYVISFEAPGKREFDSQVSVDVKVGDETARLLESNVLINVRKTDRYVVLHERDRYPEPGEDVEFDVSIHDLDGKAVGGTARIETYVPRKTAFNEYEPGELLASAEVTVPGGEKALYTLSLESPPSEVLILGRTVGTNGVEEESRSWLRFRSQEDEYFEHEGEIGVRAGVDEASVGDVVNVDILSEVEATSCLAVVYADKGTLEARTVPLAPAEDGYRGSFAVSVRPEFFPQVMIYAVLYKEGESRYAESASDSFAVTDPATGMEITAAASAGSRKPGDEVSLDILCRAPDGGPVPAELSVAAVDEALLAILPDETHAVPEFFEDALDRPAGCEVGDNARSRGEIAKVVYRFPFYRYASGAWGSDFLPIDEERWGPAARVVERFFLKDIHAAALETYIDLGMQEELAERGEEIWFGEGRDTQRRLEKANFLSPFTSPYHQRPGVGGLGGIPTSYIRWGAGGGAGSGGRLTVRRDFADTAFWAPDVHTGEDGETSVSFTVPDNVTAWRVMALGMDKGRRFGWASDTFEVSKEIVARLKAPRYFVAGDVARLTAIGHNYLDQTQEFKLALEEEGLTHVRGEAAATRTVDAGGREALYHWVEARPVDEARVITSARCDEGGDAAEYKLPIYPRGSKVRHAYAGRLRGEVAHELTVAEGAVPSSFAGELILAPSLAATLSHGLGFYRDYPYDCVEQTLNRFRVNAELAAAAAGLGLEETSLTAGLPELIERGLDKLKEQQTGGRESYSGGWPWTTGGPESPYFTAYVLDGLYDLRDSPYLTAQAEHVASNLLRTGKDALAKYWEKWGSDSTFEPDKTSLYVTDVALRTGVVARDDYAARKIADYYFEARPAQEPMSLALLASVLHQMGDDERLAVVMRNLDNGAQAGPDDTVYWGKAPAEAWRWWDDAVETTSKVLEVKLAYQPDDPNLTKMVDWLVDRRRGAAWKSTKDSAAATLALMKYIKARPELAAPIAVSYEFGSREGGLELDPTSYEEPAETVVLAWEDIAVGDNAVEIRRTSGEGPAFYTAAVEYYVEAEEIPAVQGSVTLEREYYVVEREIRDGEVKEKRKPLKGPAELGGDVEVVLKINSPYDFDYVVLEDPKPAGFVYLEDRSGYNWGAGAYVELWNRQRSALFARLPRGETVMRYRLRAEVPGTYTALPARVYGMYSPDIGSSTASAVIEIKE